MGSDIAEPLTPFRIEQSLGLRRKKRISFDDVEVLAVELTAGEVADLWEHVTEAERAGRQIDAYKAYCRVGARTLAGAPLFQDDGVIDQTPVRVISRLAEAILELSGMGIDSGKSTGDLGETSPID